MKHRFTLGTVAILFSLIAWKKIGAKFGERNLGAGRAAESVGAPRDAEWWRDLHKQFLGVLAAKEQGGGFGLIFYGDSITESWRGTSGGQPVDNYRGNLAAFQQHFERRFNAAALGVSGDETQHMMWRMRQGELPRSKPPKLAVLLIGTNDLGRVRHEAGDEDPAAALSNAVPDISKSLLQMLHLIQAEAPATKVLVLGLLPRGDGRGELSQPSVYTPALEEVNMHFQQLADDDGRVSYLDCSDFFLVDGGGAIAKELMPDALHPRGPGAERLAQCLLPTVGQLMAES